MNATLARCYDG